MSEEAFVVWLVTGDQFALFSGRSVKGHKKGYSFSTIPLVFVASLLETIRQVKTALKALHKGTHTDAFGHVHDLGAFVMPDVVIVMETNFAYGASVYMQLLYFLCTMKEQLSDLKDVQIIFATPVYLWNVRVAEQMVQLRADRQTLLQVNEEYDAARKEADMIWQEREMRLGEKAALLREIKAACDPGTCWSWARP